MIAHEWGMRYKINDPDGNENLNKQIELQYLTPMYHAELLKCIVEAESQLIAPKIDEAISISLRADGSVDRTSMDKIYVLAKIINKHGELETIFIGIKEQTERGAPGLHATVKNIIDMHGAGLYAKVLNKMSSFVTDGASVNVGCHKGLWRLIEEDARANGATQPIVMIWCVAHRSDLALRDLNKIVSDVPSIIHKSSQLAKFVRRSGLRMSAAKRISSEHNLKLMALPRHFEVRWGEFTAQLITAVLTSWKCLVLFFSRNHQYRRRDSQS